MARDNEYAFRLFLSWLNERYHREFAPGNTSTGLFVAGDDNHAIAAYVAPLFEIDEATQQHRDELAARLDAARPGSFLLWQPPGADLPDGEPDESEWIRRIVLAGSKLASGRTGEARLPVRLMLGKLKEEGGYASVTGGLGRHWTDISGRLQGSFFLDSRGLNRFTRNEEEREQLYEQIALVSQGISVGSFYEFEHEDAWSVQRLSRGPAGAGMEDGWCITGCPPGFNPADGGAIRRLLRRRITEAQSAFADAPPGATKVIIVIGAYDYMELENAGPSLRGFDPAMTAPYDIIALVADAEVKALRLSRGLPFAPQGHGA